ncbi:MAG TPA: aspartate aminotransferase family protein [Balneola sp.]|jgi:glutamate/tyrosine decarboxylase-like PLP-dependent enzyme|nr:aspartate aminotransferase family protein [Flavobacteriaceae bacterium]MAO77542.1 aspartate aminotransferase family protein [Balneola sp.]MBF63851.1 aspartate aminotransferase family protein [Balneola sp.]HAH51495.1 aspartate aminotransferase family protein [Balneola sp.]|tara:strand:+ start:3579 stop:4925 length:1347 start_codon:yes stop_codon:yes gene_type:complete
MDKQAKQALDTGLESLQNWKESYGAWDVDSTLFVSDSKAEEVFTRLSQRLKCNYPFHHPVYAGQMLKPPHPITWAAYAMAMSINPNNHALDGGPPSSEMEKEVITELADFFGYGKNYLGHLTASGTIANLEALWIARESHPDKMIAFSSNSHYTHERMCGVLAVDSIKIPILEDGSFDLDKVNPDGVGTIVVTLGTTGLGEVEPLDQVILWAKEHGVRIHIDAAYGGFFRTLKDSELIDGTSWKLMQEADSIVVDPHKHGLQPYGCGCVLFKDPEVGRFYKHDSPYTYFTSDDLHLGEISLECSRAGAAAVALWATLQCFPLKENEGFGAIMAKCRQAALKGYSLMENSGNLVPYKKPELDILGYFPIHQSTKSTSQISELSKKVFEKGMKDQSFYLSLFKVPSLEFKRLHSEYEADTETVTILRSVFMRPEQLDFVGELISRIEKVI